VDVDKGGRFQGDRGEGFRKSWKKESDLLVRYLERRELGGWRLVLYLDTLEKRVQRKRKEERRATIFLGGDEYVESRYWGQKVGELNRRIWQRPLETLGGGGVNEKMGGESGRVPVSIASKEGNE